jgi:thymidine kinase
MMADLLTVSLSEFIQRSKIAFLADQSFAVDSRALVETVDNVYSVITICFVCLEDFLKLRRHGRQVYNKGWVHLAGVLGCAFP